MGGGHVPGKLIYIDLGARGFKTSVQPFTETYPRGKEFIIHAFDLDDKYQHEYEKRHNVHFHLAAVANYDGFLFMPKTTKKKAMMDINYKTETGRKVPVINMSR